MLQALPWPQPPTEQPVLVQSPLATLNDVQIVPELKSGKNGGKNGKNGKNGGKNGKNGGKNGKNGGKNGKNGPGAVGETELLASEKSESKTVLLNLTVKV